MNQDTHCTFGNSDQHVFVWKQFEKYFNRDKYVVAPA